MSKVLITGAAGFIGSTLIKKLLNEGYTVVGIDNLNDYYDVQLKYNRLKEIGVSVDGLVYGNLVKSTKGACTFMQVELEDNKLILDLFKTEQFDYVVNLAAQAGVRYSIENPYTYQTSNIEGFLNILEGCRHNKVKHLLYASSSSVYGLNQTIPFKEEHATEHPISLYAASKKANEMMAHTYAYLYDLPVSGLRFFTVYGPWGRPDMALFKFTKSIIANETIDVYNNGEMLRDFTYVDDIVDGVFRLLTHLPTGVKEVNLPSDKSTAPYSVYNIGNGSPASLMDFVHAIEDKLGKKAKINFMPLQPGDVPRTYADTSKLASAVGYKSQTNVVEGVSNFIDWYKEYYNVG